MKNGRSRKFKVFAVLSVMVAAGCDDPNDLLVPPGDDDGPSLDSDASLLGDSSVSLSDPPGPDGADGSVSLTYDASMADAGVHDASVVTVDAGGGSDAGSSTADASTGGGGDGWHFDRYSLFDTCYYEKSSDAAGAPDARCDACPPPSELSSLHDMQGELCAPGTASCSYLIPGVVRYTIDCDPNGSGSTWVYTIRTL